MVRVRRFTGNAHHYAHPAIWGESTTVLFIPMDVEWELNGHESVVQAVISVFLEVLKLMRGKLRERGEDLTRERSQ